MWWRVPKRVWVLGSAVLLGRLAWARWVRGRMQVGAAGEGASAEDFPDTVPTVWSGFPMEPADGASLAPRHFEHAN